MIHMVTAADGAESFYTLQNEARYESVEQAIEVDGKLRNAYIGHNKLYVVDNKNTGFKEKIDKCIGIVAKMVGLPSPNSHFKKYLISIPNPDSHNSIRFPDTIKFETTEILETLVDIPDNTENKDEVEIYARKKGKKGQYVYH